MYGFNVKIAASSVLLLSATLLAIVHTVPLSLSLPLLLVGTLLATYSSFVRVYKSHLLVIFAAYEAGQVVQSPSIVVQGPGTVMQIGLGGVFGRMLGTGYLLASRIIEALLLLSAALFAFIYLIFAHFGRLNAVPFIGMWLITVGVSFFGISRFPILRDFTSGNLGLLVLLDISRWLVDALAVWTLLSGLGYSSSLLGLFLSFSIILALEKLPIAYHGFGQNELVGELITSVFSVPYFPAFLAFLIWDVTRLVSGLILTESWRNLELRRKMREYA